MAIWLIQARHLCAISSITTGTIMMDKLCRILDVNSNGELCPDGCRSKSEIGELVLLAFAASLNSRGADIAHSPPLLMAPRHRELAE